MRIRIKRFTHKYW